MRSLYSFTFLPALVLPAMLAAQTPTAVVRGQVTDAATGSALPGATVMLVGTDPAVGTSTDSAGHFRLEGPVGYHTLRVQFVGYGTVEVPDLWLRAGKVAVQQVALEASSVALEGFTVSALARTDPTPMGSRAITVEQGLRYPAVFYDPTRVAGTFAGVVTPNDQANHLVVRGTSPNATNYVLEGAEMVSPNHLSNAGTASDLPMLSGGGVNILSAQMLGPSRLLTGTLPIERSNAFGGVLDMGLRNGSTTGQEWTAQAGLIGIDLSTEGPFRAGGRSSYLVNYRYSTLGILSAMGVDLGDEAITFQDLSFHVALPFRKGGEFRVFGLGGTSSNVFEAKEDTADWEFDKDGSDITYTGRTGAVGGTLRLPAGERGTFRSTVLLSSTEQDREEVRFDPDGSAIDTLQADLSESKLSVVAAYDGVAGARLRWTVGASAMKRDMVNLLDERTDGWLLRPYANARWSVTERLTAELGMGYAHFTFNGSEALEPRAALGLQLRKGRRIALSAGQRSMLPWHHIMRMLGSDLGSNEAVGLWRSQDVVLGYDHPVNERLNVHVEVYHQRLEDVPSSPPVGDLPDLERTSAQVNAWDQTSGLLLVDRSEATNTGVELTVDHHFARAFFYQLNGTWYDSRYGKDNDPSRWNGQYQANLLAGKEWAKEGEGKVRTWGVSGRVTAAGGLRYTPFVVERRDFVYAGEPWSEQLNGTFRLDLRVYLKTDRKGRTGMWALDLQNATGMQNEAFKYYDQRKGEVVTKYQLGLIPNLSYRIEF